jgi:hypothetical protein
MPDCRSATINFTTQRQSNSGSKKGLQNPMINMIMPSLPAAASSSDCRRHSHPDCRATFDSASSVLRHIQPPIA